MASASNAAVAFNVIETTGLIGTLLIVVTPLACRSIRRLSTWYLVLCSSAVYSLSMLLLAMAHGQFGPEPHFTLCLVQGALIYSSPIWLMASSCAYALQFHLTALFYVKHYSGPFSRESKWLPMSTVILFVTVTVIMLILGASQSEIVQRTPEHFYCHFTNNIGVYAVSIFSVTFAIAAVTLEFHTGKMLYQHWKNKSDFYRRSSGAVSIGVLIRLASFSVVSVLSVATCALYMVPEIKHFENLIVYNAILSNIAAILLGLNTSIIRAWMFWKKDAKTLQIDVQVKVESSKV